MRVERTNQFLARSESGMECLIHEYTEFTEFMDRSGHHRIPGMKYLETAEGQKLNYKEKGRYEFVVTGEEFISNDPIAP